MSHSQVLREVIQGKLIAADCKAWSFPVCFVGKAIVFYRPFKVSEKLVQSCSMELVN